MKMFYEVVIDTGETANKCTIAPLEQRSDFRLFRVGQDRILGPLQSSFLLHHEGECLTKTAQIEGKVQGIASIDCVWNRLDPVLRKVSGALPRFVKIPDGFVTAYPRISKKDLDPAGGLATIEAVFTAAALLGSWDASLFSQYYFGREYIVRNAQRFLELGVLEAMNAEALPALPARTRNALQRRRDRGRIQTPKINA